LDLNWHAGANWVILEKSFCEYLLSAKRAKELSCFFKNTLLPDEGYYQTCLMNSSWKERAVNNHCREIWWEDENGQPVYPAPYVFRSKDFEKLVQSPALFARKLDLEVDEVIVKQLEMRLSSIDTH